MYTQENPEVSIYCTAFNHETYIKKTLEGFVSQITNFSYEVYIHDDCSTDRTAEIIKQYQCQYPNLIKPILQTENQYSKSILIPDTFIFPNLQGKYICICEGDDYWCDENKLQLQYDFMERNQDYVACVHNTLKSSDNEPMFPSTGDHDLVFLDVIKEGGNSYHTSSIMFRREFLFNRPKFFEIEKKIGIGDYPLAIYLSLNGKIRFIDKNMSVYTIMAKGSWSEKNVNKENILKVYEKKIEMLTDVNRYSKFMYEELIQKVILQNDYKKNELLGNYNMLRSKKYKGIWKDEKILFRFKRKIIAYFGKVFRK
ncbi:glycosyltransferase family 2 protein [Amedibacillus sp. YH-ame6]